MTGLMFKIKNHWRIILVGIYAVVVTVVLGLQIKEATAIAVEASNKLTQAEEKIKTLTHTIGDLTMESEEIKKSMPSLQEENHNLKAHIAAFAKQAAACVALKTQLQIK